MTSTPPASVIPDDNGFERRAHARFLAALAATAALAVALWLAFNTSDGVPGTTRTQLLVSLGALVFFLIGVTFYLTAAATSGRHHRFVNTAVHGGVSTRGGATSADSNGGDSHGGDVSGDSRGDTPEADRSARVVRRIRSLSRLGAVFTVAAVLLFAGLGALRIFAPPTERPVSVQFSEISGRVQLEYCPSLPSSFDALAKPTDLAGSSTLLPVWVASGVCGNSSFPRGVWLYLNRSTITVADPGDR